MTAPEWFEGPVGERPEVTIARVVSEMDELRAELELVTRERDELLRKIDAACTARDEANARYYATQRTGW
jgi:hypothetical protein